MFLKKNLVLASLCLTALAGGLEAQSRNVFVIPASGTGIQAFASDSFGPIASFGSAPAPFLVLANANASKYYVISKSPTNTVVVVDGNNFSTLVTGRFNFNASAEAAALTPDGKRLIVLANGIHIIDTASDTDLTPAGIGLTTTPNDLAISLDSTRAFLLSRGSGVATSVDLTTSTATGLTFPIPGINSTIAVAPNGLLYITAQNRLYEIDPKTMVLRFEIPLNATPGKPVFTPDGKYALLSNQTPITGSSLILVNLSNHTIASTLPGNLVSGLTIFDQIFPVNANEAYAVSAGNGKAYHLTIPNLATSSEVTFANGPITGVLTGVTSNEAQPRLLYLATVSALYRVDITSSGNLVTQQTGIPTQPFALNFTAPLSVGTPAQVILYNNGQSIAAGTALTPLVVRVTDSSGRPLSNVPVNFSAGDAGTLIQSPNVVTSNDGFAQTSVTAAQIAGAYSINATAGAVVATFSITVTGTGTGTGGSGGSGGSTGGGSLIFSVVSGNGQLVREQFQANDLLVVAAKDASGKPVAGATINYTITSGVGSLQTISGTGNSLGSCTANDQTAVCLTDANGQAGVGFRAISTNLQSFAPTTVSATYNGSAVNFIETTYLGFAQGSGFQPDPTITDLVPLPGESRVFTVQAGQTLLGALKVQVVATSGPNVGFGIPNVGIIASTGLDPALAPTANCNVATSLSDGSGIATCDLVAGGKVGRAPLKISVGSSNDRGFGTLVVTPGPVGLLNILQGNNQTGIAGQQLPLALVAQVTDAFGNILPGQKATFEVVNAGTVILKNVFDTSDQNGKVSALATLGGTPGPQQVRVKIGGIASTFTMTVNVTFGAISAVSGGGQVAVINQSFTQPLVARVVDTNGAAVPNATVSFAVNGGNATLSSTSATTDASGNASVTAKAGATAGVSTVNATVGNFTATFTLTSRLPGPTLTVAGFKNAASLAPGVTPGGIVSIQGAGLAPTVQGVVTSGFLGQLPLSLAGVDVTFNGIQAPIYSVSNVNGTEQVNVQVPFELTPGLASVKVTVSGGSSTIDNVPVLPVSPGIFETADASGRKYAVATKDVDGSYVSASNPARRGDVIRVYLTGMGQVTPSTATNRAGIAGQKVLAPIIVGVNNAGIPLGTAEYMPGVIGIYMVTFTVPTDAPSGSAVPLSFGVTDPNGTNVYSNTSNFSIQ